MGSLRAKVHQPSKGIGELKPRFSSDEASLEASRCLYCYDAPCIRACPTKIDIPSFIQQIANRDLRGSAKTIFTENIFGGSCGRACPTEVLCEGACVYNDLNDKPIAIGRLQRYATDFAIDKDIHFWRKGKDSGKRVAIVGAGPAGMSCAYELSKFGHSCVVYESRALPGGLNSYGVANYKIDTAFALKEVQYVKKIGIEVLLNTPVGKNPTVKQLLDEYDSVFLGIGLGKTAALGIEGEDLEGSIDALDFIEPTRELSPKARNIGGRVLVIGGGNTAIDAAMAAKSLGADSVTIVYRRTEAQMPAYRHEYELAKSEGIQFVWLTAPKKIVESGGRVKALECLRMKLTSSQNGKGTLEPIPGSEHRLECDLVVKALGQEPFTWIREISGLTIRDGVVVVDKDFQSSVSRLFAGGDCVNKGAEVVDAVQHGKLAARAINSFLKA